MKVAAIIPARYHSTRFEGKALVDIDGWPMIRHVYERTKKARIPCEVIVATDDLRIKQAVEAFGGKVMMTSPDHRTGTDRLAEAAERLEVEIVVNVQGDEPLIHPEMIDQAIEPLIGDPSVEMATLKNRLSDDTELHDPNVVKVVTDKEDNALYFSRQPIPYDRRSGRSTCDNRFGITYFKQIGLYVYRKELLLNISRWEPTPLESSEFLEQLRVMENGYKIKVVETGFASWGVDIPADLELIKQKLEQDK